MVHPLHVAVGNLYRLSMECTRERAYMLANMYTYIYVYMYSNLVEGWLCQDKRKHDAESAALTTLEERELALLLPPHTLLFVKTFPLPLFLSSDELNINNQRKQGLFVVIPHGILPLTTTTTTAPVNYLTFCMEKYGRTLYEGNVVRTYFSRVTYNTIVSVVYGSEDPRQSVQTGLRLLTWASYWLTSGGRSTSGLFTLKKDFSPATLNSSRASSELITSYGGADTSAARCEGGRNPRNGLTFTILGVQ